MTEMNMKVGESYDLIATDFVKTDFGGIIYLTDGKSGIRYGVQAWPFQVEENGPRKSVVRVFVKAINPKNGMPILWQDRGQLIQETYVEDDIIKRNQKFIVERVNNDNKSLTIRDERYGITHTYFPRDIEKYFEGQYITLFVSGVVNGRGGTAHLELEEAKDRKRIGNSILFTTKDVVAVEEQLIHSSMDEFPEENDFVEHKSSIVFDPETNEPNIDKQLVCIVQEIAAFINAKGGTLYLGVTDELKRCGIERDFAFLNTSKYDPYNGQYDATIDKYQLKIRNSVNRMLGQYAGSLVHFAYDTKDGKTVVIITIDQGREVVYFNGEKVFQRQGNQKVQLKGQYVSNLVRYRISEEVAEQNLTSKVDVDIETNVDINDVAEVSKNLGRVDMSYHGRGDLRNHKKWHDLHLYSCGGWAIDNKGPKTFGEPIQSISIEEYHSVERYRLLLIYESTGNVDVLPINVNEEKGDKSEKANTWLNDKGWSKSTFEWVNNPNVKMVCAHKRDLLAVVYKSGNDTFVKTIPVDKFNLHKNFAQGNTILPTKTKFDECYIYLVPQRYYENIYKLNKAINGAGINIRNKKYQPLINNLNEILSEEYNIRFM